jgi:hypothetical protein
MISWGEEGPGREGTSLWDTCGLDRVLRNSPLRGQWTTLEVHARSTLLDRLARLAEEQYQEFTTTVRQELKDDVAAFHYNEGIEYTYTGRFLALADRADVPESLRAIVRQYKQRILPLISAAFVHEMDLAHAELRRQLATQIVDQDFVREGTQAIQTLLRRGRQVGDTPEFKRVETVALQQFIDTDLRLAAIDKSTRVAYGRKVM